MIQWIELFGGILIIYPVLSFFINWLGGTYSRSSLLEDVPLFLQDTQRIADNFSTCSFCSGLIAPKENYYIHIRGIEKGLISCNICYLVA
tara:strand:+ start:693 stop:962 length:270 start_codon:yes stop_codon:yes gene_type:complete